tara:strand:+ start:1720 stop:2235 length:516 start_codon:yes stop_codon:yes gene_type:complete
MEAVTPHAPSTERPPPADDEDDSDADGDCYVLDGFVVADTDEVQTSRHPGTDVDARNIVTGKRRRRSTKFIYEDPDFADAVATTMLADVPQDELDAAISGDCGDAVILSGSDSDSDSDTEADGEARPVRRRLPVPLGSDEESEDEDYVLSEETGSDDTVTSDEDDDADEDA